MTKKKKLIISLISVVACIVIVVCVVLGVYYYSNSRKVSTPAITMSRYFSSTVVSDKKSSTGTLALSYFTGSRAATDTNAYFHHTTLTFSTELNWIYGMYLECVYFYFYCNRDITDLVATVTITGLDGNTYDASLPTDTYKVEQQIGINTNSGKGVLVKMNIDQSVVSLTSDCNLIISLENQDALDDANFKWTIYGLQVYGEHRI